MSLPQWGKIILNSDVQVTLLNNKIRISSHSRSPRQDQNESVVHTASLAFKRNAYQKEFKARFWGSLNAWSKCKIALVRVIWNEVLWKTYDSCKNLLLENQ